MNTIIEESEKIALDTIWELDNLDSNFLKEKIRFLFDEIDEKYEDSPVKNVKILLLLCGNVHANILYRCEADKREEAARFIAKLTGRGLSRSIDAINKMEDDEESNQNAD